MAGLAQKRAVANYRRRIAKQGLVRFEVIGRERDRALLRAVARKLAGGGREAESLRALLTAGGHTAPDNRPRGGILRWLLSSPLVGADIEFKREVVPPRKVDLG